MQTQQEKVAKNDIAGLAIIVAIVLSLLVCMSDYFSAVLKFVFVTSILTSYWVGKIGRTRKIGFGAAFFIALIFSPVIGFLVVFNSDKLKDEEYKEQMLAMAGKNNIPQATVAEQLHQLNELRKEGVLTDEEFNAQKEKLLKS